MHVGILTAPKAGQTACGDAAAVWPVDGGWRLCLVDGLGHGPKAEAAATAAIAHVAGHLATPLERLMRSSDAALRDTRGVVMALADVEPDGAVCYAAVGNPRARLMHGRRQIQLGADPGIVGAGFERVRPDRLQLGPGDVLVVHSDGIGAGFDLAPYAEAARRDAPTAAERIVADRWAGADDVAVLVATWAGA